jgi:hypothetical protein
MGSYSILSTYDKNERDEFVTNPASLQDICIDAIFKLPGLMKLPLMTDTDCRTQLMEQFRIVWPIIDYINKQLGEFRAQCCKCKRWGLLFQQFYYSCTNRSLLPNHYCYSCSAVKLNPFNETSPLKRISGQFKTKLLNK